TFKDQVPTARLLLFPMHKYSSFNRFGPFEVENLNLQPFVRKRKTVGSQHLLSVASSLHCSKNSLHVGPDAPPVRSGSTGDSHIFEDGHPAHHMLVPIPCKVRFAVPTPAHRDRNIQKVGLAGRLRGPKDQTIE